MTKSKINPGSFRDPSGFIFEKEGNIYRQINKIYQPNYQLFLSSGLYQKLCTDKLLVTHQETVLTPLSADGFLVIRPDKIPFISYPYEWCFSQLKDAALLTLQIQKLALQHGMILKDASAYNIQFLNGKPVFIDTLSFEKYEAGSPWIAYRQFCEHFLAPLALIRYTDVRLHSLLQTNIEGVPLDLASKILPVRSYFSIGLLFHVHLHAKAQKNYADKLVSGKAIKQMPLNSLKQLIGSLKSTIEGLQWNPKGTVWAEYYDHTSYQDTALQSKEHIVNQFLETYKQNLIWDIGANTGRFSQIAAKHAEQVIALDIDPGAVEKLHLQIRQNQRSGILPLISDLTQPGPGIGWQNLERSALLNRTNPDTILALALIHHLVIGSNIPLVKVAELFSQFCQNLIIEFIPKSDSQVQRLLQSRKDIFADYNQKSFETVFSAQFTIETKHPIAESGRTLYLLHRK